MRFYIENSTDKGQTVIDPFMGVGTTGVACINSDRKFIGIEIDKEYSEYSKKRLIFEFAQETLD